MTKRPLRSNVTAKKNAPPEASHQDAFNFGARLRAFRRERGWSLTQTAAAVGVTASSLSRIENGKMSPTLDLIQKIVRAMKLHPYDVLGKSASTPPADVVSVTRKGQEDLTELPNIFYAPLHPDMEPGGIRPILVTLFARSVKQYGGLTGHVGEEFLYILAGTIELHLEGRGSVRLDAGDSCMFSSHIPHAYVTVGGAQAKILIVASTVDPPFHHLQG